MFALQKPVANLLLCAIFALPSLTFGQGQDIEPNNSCPGAQDVDGPILPFDILGSLDVVNGMPDIDFFRFTGVPGDLVRVDHQGFSSGNGTLEDPLLGLFDGDCNLIDVNDDAGSLDSRLIFSVPISGTYVLAATAFPDFDFVGAGEGSYRLTVSPVQIADSVFGRLVDARDQVPLPGDGPPFAFVELIRCAAGSCFEVVSFQPADSNGNFRFDSNFDGSPLLVGSYQVRAFADGYEFFTTDVFEVSEGQSLDLGEIALIPFQLIGSVTGRLVDGLDGSPLSGFGPPFAFAELQRCEEFGCFPVAGASADEQGLFRFVGVVFGLPPGRYRVLAFADDYEPATTDEFDVGDAQDVEVGNIALTPTQIQFGAVDACEIPPGGGLCEYGIELRNRGPGRFKGEAWSMVEFFRNEPPFRTSRFQTGIVGATNPMPVRLNLTAGDTMSLQFQLEVPGDVPDGSTICALATVGRNPNPQFDSFGDRFLFCAFTQSGNFTVLSEKEGRKRMRENRQQWSR